MDASALVKVPEQVPEHLLQRIAHKHVSLAIAPGERILVTGPSGAGKSSLLALLLRFAEPSGGRIDPRLGLYAHPLGIEV